MLCEALSWLVQPRLFASSWYENDSVLNDVESCALALVKYEETKKV